MSSEAERDVILGIPGMDHVLPHVKPGSLIVIVGTPGSGKTLLSMQLLMEMRWATGPADERPALFLTCDETAQVLADQMRRIMPPGLKLPWIRSLHPQFRDGLADALRDYTGEGVAPANDGGGGTGGYEDIEAQAQRQAIISMEQKALERDRRRESVNPDLQLDARRRAVGRVLNQIVGHALGLRPESVEPNDVYQQTADGFRLRAHMDAGPEEVNRFEDGAARATPAHGRGKRLHVGCRALCVDGLLNLPEFRGTSPDERRDALYRAAQKVRSLVREAPPHQQLAGIITMELGAGEDIHAPLALDYLADVVLHVGVNAPVQGVRRRFLEVVKSRYAQQVLGEHALWLFSQAEVSRHRRTNHTMGWSRAMEHVRRGVVVFPRIRLWSDNAPRLLSPQIVGAARDLHTFLAGLAQGDELLDELERSGLLGTMQRLMRGMPLGSADLETADHFDRMINRVLTNLPGSGDEELRNRLMDRGGILIDEIRRLAKPPAGADRGGGAAGPPSCRFGIPGLDEMFGSRHGEPLKGVLRGTSTAIIGPSGSGKSSLAYSFMLSGLLEGDDVLFLSFDERHGTILRQMGGLTVDIPAPWQVARPDGTGSPYFPSLSEVVAKILLRDGKDEHDDDSPSPSGAGALGRLQFIHEHPVNVGLQELLHKLRLELAPRFRDEGPARRPPAPSRSADPAAHAIETLPDELEREDEEEVEIPATPRRPRRLVIDSLSDLERYFPDPLVLNGFVKTLLRSLSDWGVTTLLVLEAGGPGSGQPANGTQPDGPALRPPATAAPLAEGVMSHLADNVIVLRHVQVNNANRKCLTIDKARGRHHDLAAAEVIYRERVERQTLSIEVHKGFEGMSNVLTGHPQPANVELRLFHENDRERRANLQFRRDLEARFGDRLRYVPFALPGARRAFWRREDGRDIRPDADVTVVSLDEPWVRLFAQEGSMGRHLLAPWLPDRADPSQRSLVAQLHPHLRDRAAAASAAPAPGTDRTADTGGGGRATPSARPAGDDATTVIKALVALPHYQDIGLLLCRPDLIANIGTAPTHWESGDDGDDATDETSFETLVDRIHQELGVPGFAFNMSSVDTTACVFVEMCWNFLARQSFLCEPSKEDREAATRAMFFLARLRWKNVLPFPCTIRDCAAAAYVRAWYANVPAIRQAAGKDVPLRPVPFLTSRRVMGDEGRPVRDELLGHLNTARANLDARLQQCQRRLRKLLPVAADRRHAGPDATSAPYPEYSALCTLEQQLKDDLARVARRKKEIETSERMGLGGWSCSGAWYLGVVSNGGNAGVGWSIVEEALDPRRVEERAFKGAGLPPYSSFYRDHAKRHVPGLAKVTFGDLEHNFFGRTRPREAALGLGPRKHGDSAVSTPDRQMSSALLQTCRETPEMLSDLVRRILQDSQSNPNKPRGSAAGCKKFIRQEIDRVFDALQVSG